MDLVVLDPMALDPMALDPVALDLVALEQDLAVVASYLASDLGASYLEYLLLLLALLGCVQIFAS